MTEFVLTGVCQLESRRLTKKKHQKKLLQLPIFYLSYSYTLFCFPIIINILKFIFISQWYRLSRVKSVKHMFFTLFNFTTNDTYNISFQAHPSFLQ
jgi:hypothetical protein